MKLANKAIVLASQQEFDSIQLMVLILVQVVGSFVGVFDFFSRDIHKYRHTDSWLIQLLLVYTQSTTLLFIIDRTQLLWVLSR